MNQRLWPWRFVRRASDAFVRQKPAIPYPALISGGIACRTEKTQRAGRPGKRPLLVVFAKKVAGAHRRKFVCRHVAIFRSKKLETGKKLQRLLAQQRAIAAQIKSIEDRERERQERAIALIIRRHRLTRFDPEKLDQALAVAVTELEGAAQQQSQPQASGSEYGG